MTHFRAAVDLQRIAADPNKHISGPSGAAPEAFGEKGRMKNLSSGVGGGQHAYFYSGAATFGFSTLGGAISAQAWRSTTPGASWDSKLAANLARHAFV